MNKGSGLIRFVNIVLFAELNAEAEESFVAAVSDTTMLNSDEK